MCLPFLLRGEKKKDVGDNGLLVFFPTISDLVGDDKRKCVNFQYISLPSRIHTAKDQIYDNDSNFRKNEDVCGGIGYEPKVVINPSPSRGNVGFAFV